MITTVLCVAMAQAVVSLNVLQVLESHSHSGGLNDEQKSLRRVLESLAKTKLYLTGSDRRSSHPFQLSKAKELRTKTKLRHESADAGRMTVEDNALSNLAVTNVEHQQMVENELQDVISKHSSVLLHNAWLQKKGRNDFLVLEEEARDPFVTVIPNNIYYNIEKKCVNWMDDCSLTGIRAKLLTKVRSPYKKK